MTIINLPNVFIILGLFLGVLFSHHQIRRHPPTIKPKLLIDTNDFWNSILIITISSFVGGRFYHVLNYWKYYTQDPLKIVMVWDGGFGIIGAVILGLVGLTTFSFLRRVRLDSTIILMDLIALGLPLAQAVGRWSSYFNYNFLGLPTKLPWGIEIPFFARPQGFKLYTTYHPLFLYESLLNLFLFGFLFLIYKKFTSRKNGTICLAYLIGFSGIRSFLEPILINSWKIGVFPVASVISFTIVLISFILLVAMYIPKLLTRAKTPIYNKPVAEDTVKKSQIKKFKVQRKRKAK